MMGKEGKRKDDDLFTTAEENRRIESGMPAGDPNSGTRWKDTLIYLVILIVGYILYVIFGK